MSAKPKAAEKAGNTPAEKKLAGKPAEVLVSTYETIVVEIRDTVALVELARPELHNAFNERLIAELAHALAALDGDDNVRAVILLGQGRSFCAGADLNWMKR